MRTIDRLASIPGVSRMLDEARRARRTLRAQHPAVRLGMVLAPILAMTAAGYWAAASLAPVGLKPLPTVGTFSADDLITVCRALDARNIAYRPDDRRLLVEPENYPQAAAILADLHVGPTTIDEIRESHWGFSELIQPLEERERQERLRREKLMEKAIDDLDGVAWSVVCIRHPRSGHLRSARVRTSAFVYLEGEGDRPLPSNAIRAIPTILLANEPELAVDAITVMDRKGRPYLDPANPGLGKETLDRVQMEELRDRILDRLNGIRGVQVWVDPPEHGTPASEPDRSSSEERLTSTVVNSPADLGEPAVPPTPKAAPARPEPPPIGHVTVTVPRSYYYSLMVPHPDHREPSADELREAAQRVRELVERMVRSMIPAEWSLLVETIPDELPTTRTLALSTGAEARRLAADWGVIGASAAAVAMVLALGSWIQAARRPVATLPVTSGRRYREDAADEPGPSERVRELVRRDPEVAAGVLQRWATQGGSAR